MSKKINGVTGASCNVVIPSSVCRGEFFSDGSFCLKRGSVDQLRRAVKKFMGEGDDWESNFDVASNGDVKALARKLGL